MVTLSSTTSSTTFTFVGNNTYLQNGEITVPNGSLSLVLDESDMATFIKSASNDIFLSISLTELDMTKSELETYFKDNMGAPAGGGGSGTTYTAGEGIKISNANVISVFADTSLDSGSSNVVANSAVTNAINAKQGLLTAGTGIDITENVISVTGGSVIIDPTLYSGSSNPVANSAITDAIDAKANASDLTGYTTTGVTDSLNTVVTAHTSDQSIHVTTAQTAAWNAKQTALTAGTGIDITDNVISVTGGSSVTVDPTLDSGSTNPVANSAITAAINAKPNLVNLTQSEYDELQTKDSNTIYNITDAAVFDPSDYWTSGQTQSAITSATSGLQTTLTASTGISIVSNVISVSADTALNSGSTNVVTNAAVATAINTINSNMGGLKLVKISQADYDLLPTKDNDTLYVIV